MSDTLAERQAVPSADATGPAAAPAAATSISASPAKRAILAAIGVVSGAAAGLNWLAARGCPVAPAEVVLAMAAGAGLFLLAVAGVQAGARRALAGLDAPARRRFARYDTLTCAPLLLTLLGAWGIRFPPVPVLLLLVISAKSLLLYAAMPQAQRRQVSSSLGWLAFLFLISGFAALIYQIVWQRVLFTAYGVNIESITIIVSLFMFALGLGALAGGALSKRLPGRAPLLFFCCQMGIGLFGLVSLPLIRLLSAATLHGSLLEVSAVVFALLCIPTLLMGATLPILVGHVHRFYRNVGKTVGLLYCINTIGSAIACFLTADVLFVLTGQQGAVLVAAACNLTVGVLVWRYARQLARGGPVGMPLRDADEPPDAAPAGAGARPRGGLSHRAFVLFFAAAAGYISLSQEIVWMRLVSYMTGGRPTVFAHVLGFFLIGVAMGALLAKRVCERRFGAGGASPVRFVGGMLMASAIFYYFSIVGTATLNRFSGPAGLAVTHVVVAVVSFLLGGIFPVLCHYGARAGRSVGLAVSHLYMANIVGSTLGPLVTGFVLMDYLSTDRIVLGLSAAALLLGGAGYALGLRRWRPAAPAAAAVAAGLLLASHPGLYDELLEKLHLGGAPGPYAHRVENRSGIVTVAADPDGDIIYGGGVYDGRFNTDPVIDSNGIRRCYMIAALHREPRHVLEIGLSGGSWARVVANYRPLRKLTSVEINPGYFEIIRRYEEHRTLLDDPKVTIHVDDGRRWLNRNPGARFDLIVQNTTFHWRSYATNLLSEEYMRLCRRHLKPGGVVYCNATWSPHVPYTLARVFRHVVRYRNFFAAADRPFDLAPQQVRANLLKFADANGPVFERPAARKVLDELAATKLEDQGAALRARSDLMLITDDNMATEYKRQRWMSPDASWRALLRRCD
jgi:SAM-dependent methyltransferase